jgi:8-oxo-dGTP pyrophosphatase MutT (NUDIX family)
MANKKADYTVLKTQVDYENPYMKIHKKEVEYPNTTRGTYWVLERRGNISIIIPLFSSKETLLVGQFRVPTQEYSWEFPMGSVKGKDGITVAKQELKEETGLIANTFERIGEFWVANGHSSQKAYVYIAKDLEQQEMEPEEHEFLEIKHVAVADIHKMIIDGTIKDGPTITAYFYLVDYLSNVSSRT